MGHIEKYHQLAVSPLVQQFDRKPVRPTSASEFVRATALPQACFKAAKNHVHSLGEQVDALGKEATWHNASAEQRSYSYLSFRSLCGLNGDVQLHQKVWLSCLAVSGHLFFDTTKTQGQIVAFMDASRCNRCPALVCG